MIQIFRNGPGPWADVEVEGTTVTLRNGASALSLSCSWHQTDARKTLDVVLGPDGSLRLGTAHGNAYVATLEIPPARREMIAFAAPAAPVDESPETEEGGAADNPGDAEQNLDNAEQNPGESEQTEELVTLPLTAADMPSVILRLFTVSAATPNE